ncbi:Uncharacterised protein [Yersinia frederiksenii]|nr:Uncharacterised protein [Yersinia frederiksenii]
MAFKILILYYVPVANQRISESANQIKDSPRKTYQIDLVEFAG